MHERRRAAPNSGSLWLLAPESCLRRMAPGAAAGSRRASRTAIYGFDSERFGDNVLVMTCKLAGNNHGLSWAERVLTVICRGLILDSRWPFFYHTLEISWAAYDAAFN